MTAVAIGRRSFLFGRFLAHRVADVPARAEAAERPLLSLAPLPRRADEPAPFRRRVDARAALADLPRVARVDRFACLGSSGSSCTSCVEHCPVEGAIVLRAGAPSVAADVCDGCGACERACPAPGGAIRVLPVVPTPPPRGTR